MNWFNKLSIDYKIQHSLYLIANIILDFKSFSHGMSISK